MNIKLFTPGPTQIPGQILKLCGEQVIHHRTDEFRNILKSVNENLKYIFQSDQPVLTLTSSGTGGMEALFVNLFSPGETIITVNNGKFSQRWVDMPRAYGINVIEVELEWGTAPDAEKIKNLLKHNPTIKGVILTQCETSTGTATDIRSIANVVKEISSALICVDGISSVGAMEFRFDKWNIDACVSASQKGFMSPPGLAFICLSKRAIERIIRSATPRYYFDLRKYYDEGLVNDPPWTPAISLIVGLETALCMMRDEGIENIWKRHMRLANKVRNGMKALGFNLLSENPADSVTAVKLPPDLEWKRFNQILKYEQMIQVAGGQGKLKGKIFRIGHVGSYTEADIDFLLSGVAEAVKKCL
jgi:aspartate aminotransferase-like enzyme